MFFRRARAYPRLAPSNLIAAFATTSFAGCEITYDRRTLQHRHVAGLLGHRRDERDGGGAAADDDHPLAGVVEVFRPVLRMHDLAPEPLPALEVRRVPLVVAVVAAAAEDPVRAQLRPPTGVGLFDVDGPAGVHSRPGRRDDPLVVADVRFDAVLRDGLLQVGQDLVAAGDRVLVPPRFELVAERVQIRVRSDTGVAEQVPRATDRAAGLDDGVRPSGQVALQVVRSADAGDPGSDDQDVDMLGSVFGCTAGHARLLRVGNDRPFDHRPISADSQGPIFPKLPIECCILHQRT